jgi:linoleoyl-CoA desaturase
MTTHNTEGAAQPRFGTKERLFYSTLHKRVDEYFKSNNIKKTGNTEMYIKTVFMFALFFVPYSILISNIAMPGWVSILLCVVVGLGTAGIGLSVMHDANHGSYSSIPWLNNLMSRTLNFVGGHYFNWQMQHNVLHHTYTNVDGHDEDIVPPFFLRFSPHAEWRKIHRGQAYYAWFFYGLLTLSWVTLKDFSQLIRFSKMGLLRQRKEKVGKHLTEMILTKIGYYMLMMVLPLLVTDYAWWQVLIGFFINHFTASLLLSLIFQTAHVMPDAEFPQPDEKGQMEHDWAVHQLYTTCNFAPKSKIFAWYAGGLNRQIEHHLFPSICHVHYEKIAPIVEQTAKEFGYPYNVERTFASAIVSHLKLLNEFGNPHKNAA